MKGGRTSELIERTAAGDAGAADDLFAEVYGELRRIAGNYMRLRDAGHTLQPTALVHEAYLKMVNVDDPQWNGREHFCAVAATAMRQVLVSHARGRDADKRGGGWRRVTLDGAVAAITRVGVDPIDLDESLTRLAALDNRQARVAELRLFGGLGVEESARLLDVSPSTVKADWAFARAWLKRELSE